MVSFSTTSNTGPGLSSSAWQRSQRTQPSCEGAPALLAARCQLPAASCSASSLSATLRAPARASTPRSTRLARAAGAAAVAAAAGAADRCFLKQTSPECGLPLRSACTRQRASSDCRRPLPCCFTPLRRANRSQARASCVQQQRGPAKWTVYSALLRCQASPPLRCIDSRRHGRVELLGALHMPAREGSDSPR